MKLRGCGLLSLYQSLEDEPDALPDDLVRETEALVEKFKAQEAKELVLSESVSLRSKV